MHDSFRNTPTWPLLAHPNAHSKHGKETYLGKRHFLTLVSVGPGAGPRISTKMFKKGVFVKHPSKKVVSFWCWCEGQLKTHCERVFFHPGLPMTGPLEPAFPRTWLWSRAAAHPQPPSWPPTWWATRLSTFSWTHTAWHTITTAPRWCARPAS